MKRNFSMPKMSIIEINNRLNRLKAVNKPRLEFPTKIQSRKHYFQYPNDHVVLGNDRQQSPEPKNRRRNNMDISDIEGARPKLIQKQKNVMNYYKNKNQEYNPFVPMEVKLMRALSQPKITVTPKKYQPNQPDALDMFRKQMENKSLINPELKFTPLNKNYQYKRQITQPTRASYQNDILSRKLPTQIRSPQMNQNLKNLFSPYDKPFQRKSIVSNPTFLSNLVLL